MSTQSTIPAFAHEATDEEIAAVHGGQRVTIYVLSDGTIIVVVER